MTDCSKEEEREQNAVQQEDIQSIKDNTQSHRLSLRVAQDGHPS